MKKIISLVVLLITSMLALSGCIDGEAENGAYNIYYVNKDFTGLTSQEYTPKSETPIDQMGEIIGEMYKDAGSIDYNSSKPEDVNVTKYEIKDKTAYVYFDAAYNKMSSVREMLCRSATVLTLTQISGIDYVNIYVDGQVLLNADRNPVGNMQANDFISLYGDDLDLVQKITLTLYYANETGDKLIPYNQTGSYLKNENMEEYIIRQLTQNVEEENLYRTIPDGVSVNSVATRDGVCYLDFNSGFNEESLNIDDEVAIYSIVNSLAETGYITKVEITVNGEKNVMFHESISLNQSFVRNLDIVETKAEE
ncbi:GerMN domain-containing protein [Parasporobacterium paucivorans]|uniref:Germination protein M n=1 Tax=Parasporobacterium paucivorans DSM 15970 TaxID=1122934 RepID=A0A1M6G7J5_9FIRM|nr:GerMN domain-containing protein [Parasporobacterium paucivorans]SHJ05906.1 germination protein M [Parasporobacterium paucivorans DSM 15970]